MAEQYLRELAIGIGFQIDTTNLTGADRMTDDFKANALAAEGDINQLGTAVQDLGSQATSGMGTAALAAAGLQTQATGVKLEIDEIGNVLKENRVLIAGIFAASAGAIGTAVKTASNFEAAMSRVGAISRASDEDMALLTASARELGATTVFSASQAAEGMQYLGLAGFETTEILAAMPGLLDMAAAAQMELGSASGIASGILRGFNIDAAETGRVADVLTTTFTTSNTTLDSLGESMKMVAPIAASLGMDLEETAAIIGKLGDRNIQGSMAGTALRTILTSLASPTSEASRQMEKLGIVTEDSVGNLLPFTSILGQIAEKTETMGEAQRAAFLETIAGRQGITALSALLSVGADEIDNYAASLLNSAGLAGSVADKQLDNLQGTMVKLGSAVEGAKIAIGTAFIPVLRLGADVLTGLVTLFNKLPAPLQSFVAVGLGAVAMLSGVALAAAFIIPKLGALKTGFALLKTGFSVITAAGAKMGVAMTASFWPIVLGAAAVAAAILLVQDIIMGLRGEGDTLTGRAIAWGKELGPKLAEKIGKFSGALKVAGAVLGVVFGPQLIYTGALAAVNFGRSILQAGTGLVSFAAQGAQAALGMAKLGLQMLLTGAQQAATFTLGIAKAGIALGTQLVVGLVGATKAAIGFTAALLANPITWIVLGVVALGAAIYGLVKNWDKVKEWSGKTWGAIKDGVGGAISSVGAKFKSGIESTKNWAAGVADSARNVGTTIKDKLSGAGEWIGGMAQKFRENPVGFVIDWSPFGLLKRGTESLLGWFGDWLADKGIELPELRIPTFPDLIAWASTPFAAVGEWLEEKGIKIPEVSIPTFPELIGWASAPINAVGGWLEERGIRIPEISIPTFPDLIAWAKAPFDTFSEWISEFDIGTVIGDAIGGAWDFVTAPLEGFTGKIREWLPFSPAKEGPLSDIDGVGFGLVDTIAKSIDQAGATNVLRNALDSAMGFADDPFNLGETSAAMGGGYSTAANSSATIQLIVNVDARGASAETAEAVGQTTAQAIKEMIQDIISESFFAAALEEV